MDAPKSGDPCPKCGTPVVSMPQMFHRRGAFFDGLVCKLCNALWDAGAFEAAVIAEAAPQRTERGSPMERRTTLTPVVSAATPTRAHDACLCGQPMSVNLRIGNTVLTLCADCARTAATGILAVLDGVTNGER